MTREQWATLTDEEQQIKVAEYCGYKMVLTTQCIPPDHAVPFEARGMYFGRDCIPDYLNDLNAMHEVEKLIGEDQAKWCIFDNVLRHCLVKEFGYGLAPHPTLHATAAQRAEAFVLTMEGKV